MSKQILVPNDWKLIKLGDEAGKGKYGANASSEEYDHTKPRYVRITDISADGYLLDDDVRSISLKGNEEFLLIEGDLIFARSGATVGKTYLYQKSDGVCIFAGYCIKYYPHPEKLLPKFLFYVTKSDSYYNWVESMMKVGAQPNINEKEYSSLKFLLPPIPEQVKIAAILSSVDETIDKTRVVIAKTERLKKGLMQQLLTRGMPGWHSEWKESKVGEIPGCWEVKKLGDLLIRSQYGISESLETKKSDLPVLRMGNIQNGELDVSSSKLKYLQKDKIIDFQDYILNDGDILFNRTNSMDLVGKIALFENRINCSFASYLIRLEPNQELILPHFLNFYLNLNQTKNRIRSLATPGVSQANINVENLKKTILCVNPSNKEQRNIVNIILSTDAILYSLKSDLTKHKEIKKGLMQQLLTGKIRVHINSKGSVK